MIKLNDTKKKYGRNAEYLPDQAKSVIAAKQPEMMP